MPNAVALFDARGSAWVDPRTGRLTREAQVFLRELWLRVGGGEGIDTSELEGRVEEVAQDAFAGQLNVFQPRQEVELGDFGSANNIGRMRTFAAEYHAHMEDEAHALLRAMSFGRSQDRPHASPDSDQTILAAKIFGT